MYRNRIFKINSKLTIEAIPLSPVNYLPFNEEITILIKSNKAIATVDALLKENKIGSLFIIISLDRITELKYRLYSKDWSLNVIIRAKAIVLLEIT